MIIYPAIDIRGGRCVRLTEGKFDQETVFADDPSEMALRWTQLGAEFIHVVDLDGALKGSGQNLTAIEKILSVTNVPIQVGGGIRTLEAAEKLLNMGVERIILGSVAVRNPKLVKEACQSFGNHVVVGIDAKDGIAAIEGWGVDGGINAIELAKKMADVGIKHIIYTDISRDGMLSGVNVEATAEIAIQSGVNIIASGGVASLADISNLKKYAKQGIEGCIIGKAIYTGAIDLKAAIKLAKE